VGIGWLTSLLLRRVDFGGSAPTGSIMSQRNRTNAKGR
jgi:hypothetical protein